MAEGTVTGRGEESRSVIQPITSAFATTYPTTQFEQVSKPQLLSDCIHSCHSMNNFTIYVVPGMVLGDGNTTVNKIVRSPCPHRSHILVSDTEK